MASDTTTRREHSPISRFFRNPETGEVVVVQLPNLPLWIFLAATAVRLLLHPHGTVGTVVSIVGTVSLVVWAVLEVARGESPFRRVLGAVVLLATIVGFVTR
jgi:hypothetical protein